MVLRLIRDLPGVPGLIASVAREVSLTNLIPASGDQDHAILPSALTPFVRRLGTSTAFHPNVRDGRETPLDSRVERKGNILLMRGRVKWDKFAWTHMMAISDNSGDGQQ